MGPLKVEVFSSIEEMKNRSDHQQLTDEEALNKVLDLMDMYATMRGITYEDDGIEWIELKINDK